jgi:hypothetical protein
MTAPRLSVRTLSIIAEIVCGNAAADEVSLSPYRRFVDIDAFFEHDLGLESADLESGSRHERAEAWLRRYNATEVLPKIVEAVVGPASFAGSTMEPGPAVAYVNGALKAEGYQLVRVGTGYKLVGRMMVELPTSPRGNPLSDEYVRELADKCRVKLETGDYDGAITNARTLLEVVLGELEEALTGARSDYAGDLPRQYKAVSRMLRLDDDREDLDARFKDVVRGLVTVVNGLAPLRNKLSDGHARVRMPARHHAEVVVNAATTVAVFLGQSYQAQARAGRFPDRPASGR